MIASTLASSSPFLSSSVFRAVSAVALSSTLFACVMEDGPPRQLAHESSGGSGTVGSVGTGTDAGAPSAQLPASPAPLLVVIDTNQVMNADPGQGVGVFTEYATGGKWHVWWTCDTTISHLPCDVVMSATTTAGTITNVDGAALQGGTFTTPTPSRVEASITTTTQVNGLTFMTNPGALITLEATIGGLKEGPGANRSFFFFVQDGQINGGYTGTLTNPLQLQGKTP
jgi:hypothetical protein